MRQKLIYILKHNQFIQKAYKLIMSFVFKLIGLFVRTDERLILFVSFMGTNVNDSPKNIYDYITAKYPGQYKCVWGLEYPEKHTDVAAIRIDTMKYFITALKAKYWVTNTNIERGLAFKKKKTVYLNTWHGIALKKIGNDCPGRNDYNFNTLNWLVVSGEHDEKVFQSAFHAKSSSYLRCGMPRNEQLWNATDADYQAFRKKLGLEANQKAILYAPTWRDSQDGGRSYSVKPPIDFSEWKKQLGDHTVILVRAHHLTTKLLGIEFNDYIRDVSDWGNVNELMIACDILVTDYSAIAFDYSVLCKPLFCYTYDYDEYLAERGVYFDMQAKYPNPPFKTETELLHAMKSMDLAEQKARTKRFRDEFIQYHDQATAACVKALLGKA